jgi:uncharacterized caspase-like protein
MLGCLIKFKAFQNQDKNGQVIMRQITVLFLVLSLCIAVFTPTANAEERIALVIGNSAYDNVAALPNPKNDAAAISTKLQKLGFAVITGLDVTRSELESKAREFAIASRTADVALFFYAGHGMQVNGKNYLVPIDATLTDEADLDFAMVSLSTILQNMDRGRRTNLIFIDACRDNPLAKNLARSMGTRSSSITRGLAIESTGAGTLISFATQPGNVARDGDGTHSPFTKALLQHIETPNLDVELMMRRVREDVMSATNDEQVPWNNSSLIGSFAFVGDTNVPVPAPDQSSEVTAVAAWPEVANTTSHELLNSFIAKFPDSNYVILAKARQQQLLEAGCEPTMSARHPNCVRFIEIENEPTASTKTAMMSLDQQKPETAIIRHDPRPRSPSESCGQSGNDLFCASSALKQQGKNTYKPTNLADHNRQTAWVEGRSGYGIGEWVVVELERAKTIRGIELSNGYTKSGDIFKKNSRVQEMEVILSSGRTWRITVKDTDQSQYVPLEDAGEATWVQLRILSVFKGSKYSDTAISELRIDTY